MSVILCPAGCEQVKSIVLQKPDAIRLNGVWEILLSGGWTSFAGGNTPCFVAYERKQALLAYVTDGGKTPELNGSADAELCALLVGEVAKAIKSGNFYLQDARNMEIEQNAGN